MRNNQNLQDALQNKSRPSERKSACGQCGVMTRNDDMMPEYGVCTQCYSEGGWYVEKVEREMQMV